MSKALDWDNLPTYGYIFTISFLSRLQAELEADMFWINSRG